MLKTSLIGHAHGFRLGAVDVEEEPGCIGAEAAEEPLQAGPGVALLDDFFAGLLQDAERVVAAVFEDDLEAAGRAQPVDRRGAEDVD